MPNIVIRVDPERRQWWKATLEENLPGYGVFLWDEDHFDRDAIDYAVVWMPPMGMLASLRNLRGVFSVGAGVTHILRDSDYPSNVPIVRCVNEDLRNRMTEYILLHVLRFHRRLPDISAAQAEKKWIQYVEPLARDKKVGLLGLGNLGAAAAVKLNAVGYSLKGWSRQGRPLEGVEVYTGHAGLNTVLAESDIVVSLLPGTPHTTNLLDKSRFATMKSDAFLINVGRGETVVDADLIDALNGRHLAGATLDVFREEPLPTSHPFWSQPNVLITSHTASAIEPATGGRTISANILAFDAGENVPDIVDMSQGY